MKLNVGSGNDYRKGFINLDIDNSFKKDVVFDLMSLGNGKKLPFKDKQFKLIICYDVLEHFVHPLLILREMYRVCKKNGVIEIKVPYGISSFYNLDHKRMFLLNSFKTDSFLFSDDNEKEVELIYKEIYHLPIKNKLKNIFYYLMIKVINKLIKKNSSFYDQTFLKSLVPNTNIYVKFRKIK